MKRYTLENSFHGTKITILATEEDMRAGILYVLTYRAEKGDNNAAQKLRRIVRTLCPSPGCTCGVIR